MTAQPPPMGAAVDTSPMGEDLVRRFIGTDGEVGRLGIPEAGSRRIVVWGAF